MLNMRLLPHKEVKFRTFAMRLLCLVFFTSHLSIRPFLASQHRFYPPGWQQGQVKCKRLAQIGLGNILEDNDPG